MNYISRESLEGNVQIRESGIKLDDYDMYYVDLPLKGGVTKTVRVFTEKGTFPPLESESFKRISQNYGEKLEIFFLTRLLGPDGLMAEAKRDDYIYLGGNFLKDGNIASRNIVQNNKRTGQQNFDSRLFSLRLQVSAKEQKIRDAQTKTNKPTQPQNTVQGNIYTISDIHGIYEAYMKAVQMLKPGDKMYVLGDVVDRGTGGIKILRDMMKRKIPLVLGNHEHQMLRALRVIRKYNLTKQEIAYLCEAGQAVQAINESIQSNKSNPNNPEIQAKNRQTIEDCERRKRENINAVQRVKLTDDEMQILYIWIKANEGKATYEAFDKLPKKEQDDIIKYLEDSYLYIKKTVDGRPYLLVHASPPPYQENIDALASYQDAAITYSSINEAQRDAFTKLCTTRNAGSEQAFKRWNQAGYTTVYGHTPTNGKIVDQSQQHGMVCIDAGCSFVENALASLAVYCLNTGKATMISTSTKGRPNPGGTR